MAKQLPRGIRNNNPGNIRKGPPWQGLAAPADDGEFCIFTEPAFGIRAIAVTLITYQDKRKARDGSRIDTVQEIIERWAPTTENNTSAYVSHMRSLLNVQPGDLINVHDYDTMRALVIGIIVHENGVQPYPDATIDKGLLMAGVHPPAIAPVRNRTAQGGTVATITGGATAVAGALGEMNYALPLLNFIKENLAVSLLIVGIAVMVSVGYMVWDSYDKRRRGLL